MMKNFLYIILFLAGYALLQTFSGRMPDGKSTDFSPQVVQATDVTFSNEVQSAEWVLVDFWAPWCGPCRKMKPHVNEIAKSLDGRLRVVAVNVDVAPNTAQAFGVRGIPDFVLMRNGTVADRRTGGMSQAALQSWVESHL